LETLLSTTEMLVDELAELFITDYAVSHSKESADAEDDFLRLTHISKIKI